MKRVTNFIINGLLTLFINSTMSERFSTMCLQLPAHSSKFTLFLIQVPVRTLLPAICIVFQTNQYRSCNGTFESRSFHQACAVRNKDSRYEIGRNGTSRHTSISQAKETLLQSIREAKKIRGSPSSFSRLPVRYDTY